jgi:hypothetical protein
MSLSAVISAIDGASRMPGCSFAAGHLHYPARQAIEAIEKAPGTGRTPAQKGRAAFACRRYAGTFSFGFMRQS